MVKKNSNDNSSYSKDIKNESDNNLNGHVSDEKLINELLYIKEALSNNELDLSPEEEKKLNQDLEVLSDYFDIGGADDSLSKSGFDDGLDEDYPNDSLSIGNSDFDNLGDFIYHIDSDDVVLDDVSDESSVDLNESVLNNIIFSDDVVDDVVYAEGSFIDYSDDVFYDETVVDSNVNQDSRDNQNNPDNQDSYLGTLIDNPSKEIAISVKNVTMEYKITKEKIDTIKEWAIRTVKRNKTSSTKFVALKDISFEISKGDKVGIIGFNGAGKSTLLKLLSRVYDPTDGVIETKGKIAPLLELGAGFDNNYSGKANIFLNGALLGFSEDFLKEKYDEIVEFSELGESINYPVKNYSSGMRAKLGFSIATLVNPDILIIDEILSVGDIKFQRKSAEKLRSLIDSGITVLLVSHSVSQIRDICNKAIWLDSGEIRMMGEVNAVCDAYVKSAENASDNQLKNIKLN